MMKKAGIVSLVICLFNVFQKINITVSSIRIPTIYWAAADGMKSRCSCDKLRVSLAHYMGYHNT